MEVSSGYRSKAAKTLTPSPLVLLSDHTIVRYQVFFYSDV